MICMKKKTKIIIIIVSSLVIIAAVVAAISLNWHKIYLLFKKNGIFCKEIAIKDAESIEIVTVSLEELENDRRVTFDQSLMLVNTQYMLPDDFVPQVSEYKDTTVYMSDCMLDAYASLSAAVTEKIGKKLYVASDLRTSEEQEALYADDPLTATVPGASEHQSGLALDVYVAYYSGDGFLRSPVGRFVNSHCHEYGFIIRYPSHAEDITGIRFEPWHIRYVGQPHASVIYNNHITLEEYVLGLNVGKWYEIDGYFVCRQEMSEMGEFELPAEFDSCIISPDNTGCYIVTVK